MKVGKAPSFLAQKWPLEGFLSVKTNLQNTHVYASHEEDLGPPVEAVRRLRERRLPLVNLVARLLAVLVRRRIVGIARHHRQRRVEDAVGARHLALAFRHLRHRKGNILKN